MLPSPDAWRPAFKWLTSPANPHWHSAWANTFSSHIEHVHTPSLCTHPHCTHTLTVHTPSLCTLWAVSRHANNVLLSSWPHIARDPGFLRENPQLAC